MDTETEAALARKDAIIRALTARIEALIPIVKRIRETSNTQMMKPTNTHMSTEPRATYDPAQTSRLEAHLEAPLAKGAAILAKLDQMAADLDRLGRRFAAESLR